MSEQQQPVQIDWPRMLAKAGPYPPEAFHFVRNGLSYTMHRIHENIVELEDHERHVNGQQLCLGLRDFAIDQYGLLAPVVLNHWSIFRTDDFGRIVFAMIDEGLMSRSNDDTLDDFRSVFDFHEAFSEDQLLHRVGAG
jgi:uncharacterized repeat protein (TIGR04138 family)